MHMARIQGNKICQCLTIYSWHKYASNGREQTVLIDAVVFENFYSTRTMRKYPATKSKGNKCQRFHGFCLEPRVFAAWQTSEIEGKGEFKETESEYLSSCEISNKINLGGVSKVEIMEYMWLKALLLKIRLLGA